ncbi:MAG: hypothetical protein WDO74_32645 [Pseudomonadota bacterium]
MVRQLTGLGLFSCVLSFVLLAGCGGRASSNNADASNGGHEPSDAGSGSVAGSGPASGSDGATHAGTAGTAQAGAASTDDTAQAGAANTGGDAPAGSANAGGDAGGDAGGGASGEGGAVAGAAGAPPAVTAACSSLCDALSDCPDGGGGFRPTCKEDCLTALAVENADCTATGVDLLSCLTSALQAESHVCTDRFGLALQACDSGVRAFWGCAGTPKSTVLCVHLSVAGPQAGTLTCMDDLKCLNTLINNLRCSEATDGKSDCFCFTKFSRRDTTVNESTLQVCRNRFAECLATGTVAP